MKEMRQIMAGDSDKRSKVSEATASADAASETAPKGAAASAVRAPAVELDRASLEHIQELGHEDVLTFYRHWDGLRSDPTEIPRKDRFDPIDIPRLLGKVFLAELIEDRVRYVLLGSLIVDLEGANHAGKFLDEINSDPASEMCRHYVDLIEHRRIYVRHDTAYWVGREHMAYSVLMLPLLSDDGRISHIVGIMDW